VAKAYRVFVVLDTEYGERLEELNSAGPVWIVDIPKNREAAHKIWDVDPNRSHLHGITTFKINGDSSREENLLNELDTIDLHHGIYSADPAYTVLEIVGVRMNERIKTELAKFGFNQFEEEAACFRAIHPLPNSASE
jgi:hypothetical protein